jgi:hypothetical protein
MRIKSVAIMIVSASSLCTAVHARRYHAANDLVRVEIVPIAARDPSWPVDYNIVPRYRYRPQDDRVDTSPNAPPVAPGDIEPGGPGPSGW